MRWSKHVAGLVTVGAILFNPTYVSIASTPPPSNDRLGKVAFIESVLSRRMEKAQGNESRETSLAIVGECERQDVDPLLALAMIEAESNYDIEAISPMGARGLMQLMPKTFEMMSDSKRTFIPTDNVVAGIKYLGHLKEQGFKKTRHMLLAYNAGPWSASRILTGKARPTEEAHKYPGIVLKKYERIQEEFKQAMAEPTQVASR